MLFDCSLGGEPSFLHSIEAPSSAPSVHIAALTCRVVVPQPGIGKVPSHMLEPPEKGSIARGPPSSVPNGGRPPESTPKARHGSHRRAVGEGKAGQVRRGAGLPAGGRCELEVRLSPLLMPLRHWLVCFTLPV